MKIWMVAALVLRHLAALEPRGAAGDDRQPGDFARLPTGRRRNGSRPVRSSAGDRKLIFGEDVDDELGRLGERSRLRDLFARLHSSSPTASTAA
jgi:hypothetical protein